MANRLAFCCLAFFLLAAVSDILVSGRLNKAANGDIEALDGQHGADLPLTLRRLNYAGRFGRMLRRGYYRYRKSGDDDDDGHHHGGDGDDDEDDDDDHRHRKRDDDDDDDEDDDEDDDDDDDEDGGKKHHYSPKPHDHDDDNGSGGHSPSPDSSSVTKMKGYLGVIVYGNGHSCFVKIFQRGMTYREQFGETTSTSAFLNLFGRGECQPGSVGVAYGVVKAGVLAEARQRGSVCEANVISYVTTHTRDPDPNDGVSVEVGGAVGGEALAVCD